jgi:hypothetical protein
MEDGRVIDPIDGDYQDLIDNVIHMIDACLIRAKDLSNQENIRVLETVTHNVDCLYLQAISQEPSTVFLTRSLDQDDQI